MSILVSSKVKAKLLKIRNSVMNLNFTPMHMNEPTREMLKYKFKQDIQNLETLLNRDLSHWYR